MTNLLTTPLEIDPGAEGGSGYDYQWHLGANLCISMLNSKDVEYVVCEFHEDIIQIRNCGRLCIVQVKKKTSGSWTLDLLLKPEKKAKYKSSSILGKLFAYLEAGKDIEKIQLVGCGKVSNNGEFNLAELALLLSARKENRDEGWENIIARYESFLFESLKDQGISLETIKKGIRILTIDFSYPLPESIEFSNREHLNQTIKRIWGLSLTIEQVERVYDIIYKRVKAISTKPNQLWIVKSIGREDLIKLLLDHIKPNCPIPDWKQFKDTTEKLTSAGLKEKIMYALEIRMDAMQVQYELDIPPTKWQDFRDEIDQNWTSFRHNNPSVKGADLWKQLRKILYGLGQTWDIGGTKLGPGFAEGVFFDMTGTCEAQWEIQRDEPR